MNEIVKKLLLAGDKFMPEIHLQKPECTYSACGSFTKNTERIQKFKETGDTKYIYRNELDKPCFRHGMAYGYFKYLARRTVSHKVLKDKAFNIAKNPKYDGYERGLFSMSYRFLDKKTQDNVSNNEIKQDQQLAKELHKPIIKKLEKEKFILHLKIIFWVLIYLIWN